VYWFENEGRTELAETEDVEWSESLERRPI
jgi:hypothetical protein